jgi:hypothetical protein
MSSTGGEVGCSAVITDSTGIASCSVGFAQAAPVLVGAKSYSASYGGDTDYGPSTGVGSVKLIAARSRGGSASDERRWRGRG